MTDGDLICNFKKCRKVLTGIAYITRCSHAFCEEDGLKEIETQNFEKKCPACKSALVKSYDLVKVTLHPIDQFKSMVLAGLRPEIVMDIATRAIMFWNYQLHQEYLHQEVISKHLRDTINQIKGEVEVEMNLLKSELQSSLRKCQDLEKELEVQNSRLAETTEKLTEKTREVQKLQMMYEALKRKQLSSAVLQELTNNGFRGNPVPQHIGPETMDDILANQQKASLITRNSQQEFEVNRQPCGYQRELRNMAEEFVFQPRAPRQYTSPKVFIENAGQDRFQLKRNFN